VTDSGGDTGTCDKPPTWYQDADGDGYGDASLSQAACVQPEGCVADDTDCDDTRATVHPGAAERETDGSDDDCDGAYAAISVGDLPAVRIASQRNEAYSDYGLGKSVAMAGDMDGDGLGDILVSSYGSTADKHMGLTYVFDASILARTSSLDGGMASAVLTGGIEDAGSLDWISAAAGDLDGDGYHDILVGGDCGVNDASGVLYVARGPFAGATDLSTSAQAFHAEYPGAEFGRSIGPGDLDGDGYADIVFTGSDDYTTDGYGNLYVMHGPVTQSDVTEADTIVRGSFAGQHVGRTLVSLGDVDGDGRADFAYGGVSRGGGSSTFIVTDAPRGVADAASTGEDIEIDAKHDTAGLVATLGSTGDLDGDGYDDLAIIEWWSAQVFIVYGPRSGVKRTSLLDVAEADLHLDPSYDPAGTWLETTALGDWNGDGHAVLGVADTHWHPPDADCEWNSVHCWEGAIFLVGGPVIGTHDLQTEADRIEGEFDGGYLGGMNPFQAMEGGADVDGDGFPDLVVGAPGNCYDHDTPTECEDGFAYVIFGGGVP